MRITRSVRIVAAVSLLGLAGAAIGTSLAGPGQAQSAVRRLTVETISVRAVDAYETCRTYSGTLVAARVADLSLSVSGELQVVHVDQGERVTQGQVLAELDTAMLRARRDELVAERAAAQAVMDELDAGARPETIAAAQAQLRNLEAQVQLQRLTWQRRESLSVQRAVSQADVDQARYGLESAEALRDAAAQQLAELEAGPRTEKKQAQRATLQRLDAAIAAVDAELENSRVVAPFAGTITARHLDEGAVIGPGRVVLRLVEDTRLEAWFGLPVTQSVPQRGTRLQVRVGQRQVPARLAASIAELDEVTRTRRVVLALEETTGLVPGQLARWDIQRPVDAAPHSYWLPTTALVQGPRGLWNCFVVVAPPAEAAAGSLVVERRDVKIVHTAGPDVLVQGLLTDGEHVISTGTHRVAPGQPVRLAQPF